MSNFVIFSASQLKPSDMTEQNIVLSAPKDNKSGFGKSVNIRYTGKSFSIQTPKMRAPFGLSKFDASKMQKTGQPATVPAQESLQDDKWSISLAFDVDGVKEDVLAKTEHFKEVVEEFDNVLLDKACSTDKSVLSWVGQGKSGKQLSRDVIENRFVRSTFKGNTVNDRTYPDTFRCKVTEPITKFGTENKYHTTFFHHSDRTTPLNIDFTNPNAPNYATKVIPQNSYLICVAYASIWSTQSNWGVRWTGQQVVVFPAVGGPNLKICAITVDPEEEDDQEQDQDQDGFNSNDNSNSHQPEAPKPTGRGKSTVDPPTVDESNEDDEEDYVDEGEN